MKLSDLTRNLRGPWMITPEQAAMMAPILQGVINGYITEFDAAPQPYLARCGDLFPAPAGEANPYEDKSVYVTHLMGTMMKYDYCGDRGTRTIGNDLLEADANPDVIGHIIIADSGGGSTSSVAELSDAIRACTKPVVAWVDGVAGSACYYAISYCDRILAHQEMDSIGCIGTLIQLSGYPKFRKDSDGYVSARIYADAASEKNADYEAALEGNFQVIKEQTLNPINERFRADVRGNRPAVQEDQLSGRTYFAKDVVGTMIDSIGSFNDAVAAVMELATPKATNTSHNMEQNHYPTLEAMPVNEGLVIDADGSTTLQPAQLEAVEAVLANEAALRTSNGDLQQQLDTANQTIADRDQRIRELESSLAAAEQRINNPVPENPQVDANPEGSGDVKSAEDWDSALDICNAFLKK
jgi:protease-4